VRTTYSNLLPTLIQGNNQIEILGEMDVAGNQNHDYLNFVFAPILQNLSITKAPWTLVSRSYNNSISTSDGTTLGTHLYPLNWGDRTLLTDVSKDKVFFVSSHIDSNGNYTYDLNTIKGDGQGIVQITSNADLSIRNSLNMNDGRVAFLSNNQLIISDGTPAGTISSIISFIPNFSTLWDSINNNYWFASYSVPYGTELGLLKINVDGTATSKIVKDINPSGASSLDGYSWYSNPTNQGIVLPSGKLLFAATNSRYNGNYDLIQLFISDGTEEGTIRLGEESTYTSPSNFTNLSNKIIFISSGYLTVSDGTDSGTHFLTSIDNIGMVTSISKVNNDTAYFFANSGLYSTDGSTISKICDLNGTAQLLKVTQNKVYFSNLDQIRGRELWVVDRDDNSFQIVKDILAGTGSALEQTSSISTIGDKIIFPAYIDANTRSLFISDGTESGTIKISNDVPINQVLLNNTLIFSNSTGVHSVDTSAQVPTVLNLNTNAINAYFQQDLDQVFFKTSTGDLFATTGQTAVKLAENVTQFKVLEENAIYFMETETVSNFTLQSLWYSDGTVNGTHFVSYDTANINLDNAVVIHTVGYPQ
jgi:ELWxxDGT repeat protein